MKLDYETRLFTGRMTYNFISLITYHLIQNRYFIVFKINYTLLYHNTSGLIISIDK